MTTKYWIIETLVAVGLAFSAGRFMTPAKVETVTQEKIVYRDKIVQDDNKQVQTHTVETKKPDGTDVIVTDTGEKDVETTVETQDEMVTSKQTTVVTNRPDWQITAGYTPGVPFVQGQQYQGIIQRRLFSELYAGVSVSSTPSVGLVLSVGF